jgi:hypothetical protein
MEVNGIELKEINMENDNESTVVRFEEKGDEFIGKYIGFVEYEKDGEKNIFYKFNDINGDDEEFIMFPTSVLKTKMARVPLDAIVKIVYVGKVKSNKSRYSYKDFQVFAGVE